LHKPAELVHRLELKSVAETVSQKRKDTTAPKPDSLDLAPQTFSFKKQAYTSRVDLEKKKSGPSSALSITGTKKLASTTPTSRPLSSSKKARSTSMAHLLSRNSRSIKINKIRKSLRPH